MKKHKYITSCLLILSFQFSNSQIIRGLGTFGFGLDKKFQSSGFINIGAGIEFKVNHYFRPEFQSVFYVGFLLDETNTNKSEYITNKILRDFYAVNFVIAPKITLDFEDENYYLQLVPRYNITYATGQVTYLGPNPSNTFLIKTDSDILKELNHSIGFAIGIIYNFSDKNYRSIGLNLTYDNVNIGNTLTNLKYSKNIYHVNNSIGFSVLYYFGFTKRKNI